MYDVDSELHFSISLSAIKFWMNSGFLNWIPPHGNFSSFVRRAESSLVRLSIHLYFRFFGILSVMETVVWIASSFDSFCILIFQDFTKVASSGADRMYKSFWVGAVTKKSSLSTSIPPLFFLWSRTCLFRWARFSSPSWWADNLSTCPIGHSSLGRLAWRGATRTLCLALFSFRQPTAAVSLLLKIAGH